MNLQQLKYLGVVIDGGLGASAQRERCSACGRGSRGRGRAVSRAMVALLAGFAASLVLATGPALAGGTGSGGATAPAPPGVNADLPTITLAIR
ncbi:MAG: hypothetical protein ACREX6_01170, partial [Casimicrobiaceae bacterium]